jgi:hypothetical protein
MHDRIAKKLALLHKLEQIKKSQASEHHVYIKMIKEMKHGTLSGSDSLISTKQKKK